MTDGELNPSAVEFIGDKLKDTPNEMFVDVGDGFGLVTIQIAFMYGIKTLGIELNAERFNNNGWTALRKMMSTEQSSKIKRKEANAIHEDFTSATVIYWNCVVFSENNKNALKTKFVQEAPNLRLLITLLPICTKRCKLSNCTNIWCQHFQLESIKKVNVTWTKTQQELHFYEIKY